MAGDPLQIIPSLVEEHAIDAVYWNRCYEPWRSRRDTKLKEQLQARSLEVRSFNASLLWEPWSNLKKDGTPYKVFTPFYKHGVATIPVNPIH